MANNCVEWHPTASLANLKIRARILSEMRAFFSERDVLEVETPLLSKAALSDPSIESFCSRYLGPEAPHGRDYYLHTSPEFPMKRLLSAGYGAIFQICKVFRQGESGQRHSPEFTLLEWYRPSWSYQQLMLEVEEVVLRLLAPYKKLASSETLTYQQAFLRYVGIDPFFASVDELINCSDNLGISAMWGSGEVTRDDWLNLILSHVVEPKLGQGHLTFLCDYPPSQAALAAVRLGSPNVAERFELYLEGIELANGFHELVDGVEQRQRFEEDLIHRRKMGLPQNPLDEAFLAALCSGMPPSSGVALGVDRLIMLACGASAVEEVISFSLERS